MRPSLAARLGEPARHVSGHASAAAAYAARSMRCPVGPRLDTGNKSLSPFQRRRGTPQRIRSRQIPG